MRTGFLAALSIVLALSASCSKNPDETRIREILDDMQAGMNEKAFDRVLSYMRPDYTDNMNQSLPMLKPRLDSVFRGYERLDVSVAVNKIEIQGGTATASLKLKIQGISGNSREWLYGTPLGGRTVNLSFLKLNGEWKIYGASVGR